MISYKVLIDERRTKHGNQYPVAVRITSNRKTSYYYLGLSIQREYWDNDRSLISNLHPNYKELNRSITPKFLKSIKSSLLER